MGDVDIDVSGATGASADISAVFVAEQSSTTTVTGTVTFERSTVFGGSLTGSGSVVLSSSNANIQTHEVSGSVSVGTLTVDATASVLVDGFASTTTDVVVDGGSVVVEGEVEVSFGSLELKGNAELTVDAKSDDYVAIDISGDVTFPGSNQEITVEFDRSSAVTPLVIAEFEAVVGTPPVVVVIDASASAMARRALLQNTTDSGVGFRPCPDCAPGRPGRRARCPVCLSSSFFVSGSVGNRLGSDFRIRKEARTPDRIYFFWSWYFERDCSLMRKQ